MDAINEDLDELMGKDRNHPLHVRLKKRDHFDDPDVCRNFLVAFCPHDLFPNTKADLGKCTKRHDGFFKEMFKNDSNREYYARKYEAELIDKLDRIVSKVDDKIKRSMTRIEAPMPENYAKSLNEKFQNQANDMRDQTLDKINDLNEKINLYLEQAEKKGEEGLIDESEELFKEIGQMKLKKQEMEATIESTAMNNEKNMSVCEICGAMQSATDTDKRMVTHLEGKLHQGFAKIRKILSELKQKRDEYRQQKEREGRYERSPSPRAYRAKKEEDPIDIMGGIRGLFSSKVYGSGTHMPEKRTTSGKYANAALEFNKNSIGVPVEAPDFKKIEEEKLARKIAWEKEHGYVDGKPPPGMGRFGTGDGGGRGRGRGRGGVGFRGRGGGGYDRGGYNRGGDGGGYGRGGYNRDNRDGGYGGGGYDRGGGYGGRDHGGGDRYGGDRHGGGDNRDHYDNRRRDRGAGGYDRDRRRY